MDIIEQLSQALADRAAKAAPAIVAILLEERHASGMLWAPDVVVTSDEAVGDHVSTAVRQAGRETRATLAGRDPATNVAVFRLASPLAGGLPPMGAAPLVGSLAQVVGADATGAATARLAMVHATGPEWHSLAGGAIDALIRLDVRLGADEGGMVLDQTGAFLGMAASGPRRRALVIPAATIARVVGPLLEGGRIPRGWLGVGLQSVAISEKYQAAAGQRRGAMVLQVVAGASADQAGVLPGDILLTVDGQAFGRGRRIVSLMGPERVGLAVPVRLLRGPEVRELYVTISARPG